MNVTNKSWEEILKQFVFTHGTIGVIIAVAFVALILGWVAAWHYLSKIRYKTQLNKLEELKEENSGLKNDIKNLKEANAVLQEKMDAVIKENDEIIDRRHVREALKKDELGNALKSFAKSE